MIKNIKDLKDFLEKLVFENGVVFITPHVGPDCDAIASAVGLNMIVKALGKEAFIVIDEDLSKVESGVRSILEELPKSIKIIKSSEITEVHKCKKRLLVTVDTNKKNLVPINDYSVFKDILLIDHHECGELTIPTEYMFIDPKASSASEIMFQLMCLFGVKVDYKGMENSKEEVVNIANYLLGGINLDTSKFSKNVSSTTMGIVSKLMKKGADMNYVNNLFLDDFESDMRIQNLVSMTAWNLFNIGISLNTSDIDRRYTKEELAKAADWLLKYKATDASFALGYLESESDESYVYISARSKGRIDVGVIMSQMGGGGNEFSGAAKIESNDINEVRLTLDRVIRPGYRLK